MRRSLIFENLGGETTMTKESEQLRNEIIEKLSADGVIEYGSVELASGQVSDYYVDIKETFGNPAKYMRLYVEYIKLVFGFGISGFTCVAGSGNGGVPLATSLAYDLGIKLCILRDKPKNHGKPGLIDGHVPNKNDVVFVVDDVFTTGESIEKMLETLRKNSPKIGSVFVVCNRSGEFMPKVNGLNVGYIITPEDLRT